MTQVTKPILLDETGVIIAEKLQHIANAIDPEGGGGELDELSERVAIIEGKEAGWDAKANKDGYYSQMGVGVADNLAGKGDGVPAEFTDRPTGGTADVADGVATFKSIEGNTIVWNQLIKVSSVGSSTKRGITITRNSDNSVVLNGEATDSSGYEFEPFGYSLIPSSHIVLIACIPVSGTFSAANNNAMFWDGYPNSGFALLLSGGKKIVTARTSMSLNTPFYGLTNISVGDTFDNYTLKFEMFDLTQMFGAGNEPTTVAEFEALFPNSDYAYNAGQLLSLNMTGIKTDGFNQAKEQPVNMISEQFPAFDKNKYTRVLGGQVYYLRHDSLDCTNWRHSYKIYDLNGNLITDNAFTEYSGMQPYCSILGVWLEGVNNTETSISRIVFTKDCYVYFGFGQGDVVSSTKMQNFCINLSHSGVRNGEYEPYWTETRNIPVTTIKGKVNGQGASVVIFPDGMKSAGTAHDEIVGNKAIKRIGVVDLGSLSWSKHTSDANTFFVDINDAKSAEDYNSIANALSPIYSTVARNGQVSINKSLSLNLSSVNSRVFVVDSAYTDAAAFKAAMQGVMLYYELAEPIEYIIDESDVPNYNYKVADFGTETLLPEGVDEQGVPKTSPIKAQIVYGMNAVDTLRNLPKNFISKESMDAILTAFKTAGIIEGYTLTYNASTGKYECEIVAPTIPE